MKWILIRNTAYNKKNWLNYTNYTKVRKAILSVHPTYRVWEQVGGYMPVYNTAHIQHVCGKLGRNNKLRERVQSLAICPSTPPPRPPYNYPASPSQKGGTGGTALGDATVKQHPFNSPSLEKKIKFTNPTDDFSLKNQWRLECVGHSFAYVAQSWFLRDAWIRTQSAAIASGRATN